MDAAHRRSSRSAATDGGLRNEARLLMMRVWTGTVTRDGLRLAAYLGDPVARFAIGSDAPDPSRHPRRWARGLVRHGGEEACARAVILLHGAMLHGVDGIPPTPPGRGPWRSWEHLSSHLPLSWRYALSFAQEWLEDPTPRRVESVLLEVGTYRSERQTASRWGRWRFPPCTLPEAVLGCATSVLEQTLMTTAQALSPGRKRSVRDQALEVLRDAISADLVAWSLGE